MITCGNRKAHNGTTAQHASIDAVRACYANALFSCYWLVTEYAEDGPRTVECGAEAVSTDRGWYCADGHSHVNANVRHAESWDYAHHDEAAALRKSGVTPVDMTTQREILV